MSSLYLERYAWKEPVFSQKYPGNPDLIIVIPAFNESQLPKAIEGLQNCIPPEGEVLIIVIVNEPENCLLSIHKVNEVAFAKINRADGPFPVQSAWVKLAPKKAGVGLARKIGMDEAVRIFEAHNKDGIIICYDGDCMCEPNFLVKIEAHFKETKTQTALTFYEHPLNGENSEAIINYELYLRYYVDALRWTGFPYAFQTLGSCISVRSKAYMKQGGMYTRKAGEDFYFVHKMTALGYISEINSTTIFPSSRLSDRVPFGTGHAIGQYLDHGREEYPVYAPKTFEDLKYFLVELKGIYEQEKLPIDLPESISSFLEAQDFENKLQELIRETSDYLSFEKRFYHWLDGLKVLKLVHHCRDHHYQNQPVLSAIHWINQQYFHLDSELNDKQEALLAIRAFDRSHPFQTM